MESNNQDKSFNNFLQKAVNLGYVVPKAGTSMITIFEDLNHFFSFDQYAFPDMRVGVLPTPNLQSTYSEEFSEYPTDSCIIGIAFGKELNNSDLKLMYYTVFKF